MQHRSSKNEGITERKKLTTRSGGVGWSMRSLLPPFTTCTPTCNPYPTPLCALRCHMPPRHHRPLHTATALYTPPPPSTRRRYPLHTAAAALYTPPPLPSTRRHCCPLCATPTAPMCHCRPHHQPLPLCAAPPLPMAFMHAPRAARAPWGAHCRRTCLTHVHTSYTGPCATPLCPPCLGPIPGPIRGHALCLSPHHIRPRLLGPIHSCAPCLSPHRVRPRLPGPICGCAPHLSPCRVRPRLLGPIHGHATRSCDRVRVTFVCHWVAHTHRESMGNCRYTVDTLYEHVW